MVIMNLLRMLADVSFFAAFAGLIAAACGGTGAFAGMLIQCVCFALSWLGGERRWLRLVFLLPMALGWAIHAGTLADVLLLIPTAAYIVWSVWKRDYDLEQERHQRLFHVFWKLLIAVVLFAALMGGGTLITAVVLPYALVMLVCSVLLMRALRHDRKIYCQKKYQLLNASAVAAMLIAAFLISSKVVLNAAAALLRALYAHLIRPILELLLQLLLYVIQGIAWFFSLFPGKGTQKEEQEPLQLIVDGAKELFGEEFEQKEPAEWLRVLGIVLLIAAVIALLVLFFRWLNRHGEDDGARAAIETQRTREATQTGRAKQKENSPIRAIRGQYRRLLKLYAERGLPPERNTTSLDIHRQAEYVSVDETLSGQIRWLYIRARYGGKADPEDAKKMKKFCTEAKKSAEAQKEP